MDRESNLMMQKEILVKDDGRRLIYYRFVPAEAGVEPAAVAAPPSEEG
jgi:hypothetical protein